MEIIYIEEIVSEVLTRRKLTESQEFYSAHVCPTKTMLNLQIIYDYRGSRTFELISERARK